jgi:hypothetical protein
MLAATPVLGSLGLRTASSGAMAAVARSNVDTASAADSPRVSEEFDLGASTPSAARASPGAWGSAYPSPSHQPQGIHVGRAGTPGAGAYPPPAGAPSQGGGFKAFMQQRQRDQHQYQGPGQAVSGN